MKIELLDLIQPYIELVNEVMLGNEKNNRINVVLKKDIFFEGWKYFVERLNREKICASLDADTYSLEISFSDNDFESEIDVVVDFLRCKFFEVSPTVRKTNVLVKPTHRCNLNCNYCYEVKYRQKYKNDMSMETLEKIISCVAKYAEEVQWIWHGGEATLMGAEWFRMAHNKFKEFPMLKVDFSVMSNGVLLTPELAKVFDELGISYGISYDYLNQKKERTYQFEEDVVFNNIKAIQKGGKNIGTINVVTKDTIADLVEMYEFYKSQNIGVSFNMVFNSTNHIVEDLEYFKIHFEKFFRHWVFDENGISERTCLSLIKNLIGDKDNNVCTFTSCQHSWMGINADGQITPCDRVYPEEYFYQNIHDIDVLSEAYESEGFKRLCSHISQKEKDYCVECGYFNLCGGLCNATHTIAHNDARKIDENVCGLYKVMFAIAYKVMREISVSRRDINPYLLEYLVDIGFIGVEDILYYIKEKNLPFELTKKEDDFITSGEFAVFHGLNSKMNTGDYSFHKDFTFKSTGLSEEEIKVENKNSVCERIDVLLNQFKEELLLKLDEMSNN